MKDGGRSFRFRRGISLWLIDELAKEQREMEEECWGFYRRGLEGHLVRGDGAGVIAGAVTRKGGEIARVDAADRWVPPVIGG
jgi:hypothetical protein